MKTILDDILETKRHEVAAIYADPAHETLERQAQQADPPRDFYGALVATPARRRLNLIAEIKKASPSKGLIRPDFDPPALARAYQAAGANALSVLTDETYFQGHLDYLRAVRAAVDIPLLRKEFIIDRVQILQARAAGGDAVLLIAAALDDHALAELMAETHRWNMTVLLEVHNAGELRRALALMAAAPPESVLLGINNRNLHTFEVDLATTQRLREQVGMDASVPVVSESGIATRTDIDQLAGQGVTAVLVGETLMRNADVGDAIHTLMGPV
jgi:indole-3-glycerol phosphate synthase